MYIYILVGGRRGYNAAAGDGRSVSSGASRRGRVRIN